MNVTVTRIPLRVPLHIIRPSGRQSGNGPTNEILHHETLKILPHTELAFHVFQPLTNLPISFSSAHDGKKRAKQATRHLVVINNGSTRSLFSSMQR
jgi:hypothetical protein